MRSENSVACLWLTFFSCELEIEHIVQGACVQKYTWYLKPRLNSTVSCCCHQTLLEGSLFVHGTQSRGVERVRECFLSILRPGALFLRPLLLALGTVSDCKRVVSLGFLANMLLVCFLANIPSSVLPRPGRCAAHFCFSSQANGFM